MMVENLFEEIVEELGFEYLEEDGESVYYALDLDSGNAVELEYRRGKAVIMQAEIDGESVLKEVAKSKEDIENYIENVEEIDYVDSSGVVVYF